MIKTSEHRLGDLCKRFSSGKGITAERISETGDYPVIGGNGLRGFTDTYNFDGECAVIGRQGAYCGNVQFFSGKGYMTEHAVVTEPNDSNNAKYLTYKLSGLQLGRFSGQAAQPGLSVTKLARLRIEMPPKWYQDKVADIISSYDNLIEVNNKRIKVLEQMAENLYKEWFVRFRFPGHETAEFENGIPKGWRFEKLGSIAEIIMGQSPESEFYNTDGIGLPFHQGVGSYGDYYLIDEVYSTEGKRVAEPNSIIFSVRAPVGRININIKRIILGRGVASINEKSNHNGYLYWTLKSKYSNEDSIGNGTIFMSVTKDELFKQKMLIPDMQTLISFDSFAKSVEANIRHLCFMNQNLVKQRDLLLPRLMSGKLEVQ